jgi:hypothetical protein
MYGPRIQELKYGFKLRLQCCEKWMATDSRIFLSVNPWSKFSDSEIRGGSQQNKKPQIHRFFIRESVAKLFNFGNPRLTIP